MNLNRKLGNFAEKPYLCSAKSFIQSKYNEIKMEGNRTISKERAAYLERARKLQEAVDKGEKISLWERAERLGVTLQLAPGFSFDSDSKVKMFD